MPGKQHFRLEDWVDFVNGNISTQASQSLQDHLQKGCSACVQALHLWNHVREAAKREATYEVPGSVLQHVQGAFSVLAEKRRPASFLEIPRLAFDSLWQPALVGVRSTGAGPRQVLYRTDSVCIELRIEPEALSERFQITGQIYSSSPSGPALPGIAVGVLSPNGFLAETRTNEFGEFQVGFVPEPGLRISFVVENDREISIPLDARGASNRA